MSGTLDPGSQSDDTVLDPGQNALISGETQTADETQTDGQKADDQPKAEPGEIERLKATLEREKFLRREARRQARTLEERLAAIEAKNPPEAGSPEAMDAEISRRAEALADARVFNSRCNDIYRDGVKAFPDFEGVISEVGKIGAMTREIIEAADEAGNPAAILYHLGKDLDEADRIKSLPPSRQGAAIARFSATLATGKAEQEKPATVEPRVSRVPAPIRTVEGRGQATVNPDHLTGDAYLKYYREAKAAGRIP